MNNQFKDLLKIYKDFVKVFNNWETTGKNNKDTYNYIYLTRIYSNLCDLLVSNNIIERYGIKNYKVVESGEII